MTHLQAKKLQVSRPDRQRFLQFKPASTKTSALLLATGLSLSVFIPAYAAGSADKTISVNQKPQLISQGGKTVEITLVSYAVTKAAYQKIIPEFVAKWKYRINFPKFLSFIMFRVWEAGILFRRSFLMTVQSLTKYKVGDANVAFLI